MDGWGLGILGAGLVLYFATKKQYPAWLFVAGVGAGIVVGAVWAMVIINRLLP